MLLTLRVTLCFTINNLLNDHSAGTIWHSVTVLNWRGEGQKLDKKLNDMKTL